MTKKLLICPFFGDLPPWYDRWLENSERLSGQGYDFLFERDENDFRERVFEQLGAVAPRMHNTGKVWDFRPALGALYAEEIDGFDWWGHTDFDCVYGRVDEFVTERKLAHCDIYTDCAHGYLAGPFTLYRVGVTEWSFLEVFKWRQLMEAEEPSGWIEQSFTTACLSVYDVTIDNNHAYENPELLAYEGDSLMHGDREIPFFHFRRSKRWPL